MTSLELWVLGEIDSRELYIRLSVYGLNVFEMITKTYVYGAVEAKDIRKIIDICSEYGEVEMITPATPP